MDELQPLLQSEENASDDQDSIKPCASEDSDTPQNENENVNRTKLDELYEEEFEDSKI